MKLSVIIVNYNVQYFLEQCLKSVFHAGRNIDMEVFVVDNNSVDGSVAMVQKKFPKVKLIANKDNKGFSSANNQAIHQSTGEYVLLLNPDTVVEDDTFEKTIEFMDQTPDAGGLGVKMIDGEGKFLPESKRGLPTPMVAFYKIFGLSALFPKSKVFGKYHLGFLENDKTHSVDVLSGAFMLMRKETLQKTGYLDESFFMYGEDIDLSYRITLAGYKNYYFPHTRIIHYKGESTKKSSINYVFVFYNAMIIFAQKHFSQKNAKAFSFLINLAIYFRAFLAITARFFKRIAIPILDILIIFTGFIYIKQYWESQYFNTLEDYYPPKYLLYVVPTYMFLWLFSVYINGGYDRPVKLFRIVRGIGMGTIIILVIYALLPISLRFSRALILLGSLWALISMLGIRILTHFIQFRNLDFSGSASKRIGIVGKEKEAERVALMLRQGGYSGYIGLISAQPQSPKQEHFIGNTEQLHDLIEVYKINELIFCADSISSQNIISQMSVLKDNPIQFKIAPPESLYIIGSKSIDTFGDIFTVDINTINQTVNKRNKRLFDLLIALTLLATLPLAFVLVKKPLGMIRNIFQIIFNQKTWVSYHKTTDNSSLPTLKPGVVNPADIFSDKNLDAQTLSNLNTLYAKDYSLSTDANILLKSYRFLGN